MEGEDSERPETFNFKVNYPHFKSSYFPEHEQMAVSV